MLVEILKRFNSQQSGPGRFSLPDGDDVDLRSKHDRATVTKWILSQFGGDEDEAVAKVESITNRALAKAKAPWPYLIRAIKDEATNQGPKNQHGSSCREVAKLVRTKFGKARLDLLAEIKEACAEENVVLDGRFLKLSEDGDRLHLYNWLLSQHHLPEPFEFYHLVSPQFLFRYEHERGFQNLAEDLRTITAMASERSDVSADRALLQDVFTAALVSRYDEHQRADTELGLCIRHCKQFCASFHHPSLLSVHLPHRKGFCTLADNKVRETVVDALRKACERDLNSPRSIWVKQALRYGVITNPVSYLLSLAEYDIDPVEDWMPIDSPSKKVMTEEYGFVLTVALFPELVVQNGK